jgi:hypothetical protein
MKRMCCLCCPKNNDTKIKSKEEQEKVCEFTDLTDSSIYSNEITFLIKLKKIQFILKNNDELFDVDELFDIDELYHSFKQFIIKYNNNSEDFNEMAFEFSYIDIPENSEKPSLSFRFIYIILHEIIQLKSIHSKLLFLINEKIQTHAKYLIFKQKEEEILEKSNTYIHELKKIINIETNREIWIDAKKKEKITMLYMDKASQLTWEAKTENVVALREYNEVILTFSSKKEVIISMIEQLLIKIKKIDDFYFNI